MIKEISNLSKRKWLYDLNENALSNSRKVVEVFIKPNHWENLSSNVVLPFSIHSRIYNGITGDLKIRSFIKTVKSYSKNKILILLSEGAHLHVLSLKHLSYEKALEKSTNDANQLLLRFKNYFEGCEVALWQNFVWENTQYKTFKILLNQEYATNRHLQDAVQSDVARLSEFMDPNLIVDRDLFQQKSCFDLLEMLAGLMVMNTQNYKVIIYPGSMPNAFNCLKNFTNFDGIFINASIKVRELKKQETAI